MHLIVVDLTGSQPETGTLYTYMIYTQHWRHYKLHVPPYQKQATLDWGSFGAFSPRRFAFFLHAVHENENHSSSRELQGLAGGPGHADSAQPGPITACAGTLNMTH